MRTLPEWLDWQAKLHLSQIDLGLDRIRLVAEQLKILMPSVPVITVAGTNGKGSTVAFLHAMLSAQGYKTGAYTTPFITKYNETICIDGASVSNTLICDAFETIDKARGDVSLTSFEFGALAAMLCFFKQQVDVILLEVGLGGRLDAVNLWDTNLALITTISIDHTSWLGNDRETIGKEKAGIMRANTPVVCGEGSPPHSIAKTAQQLGAKLIQNTQDYSYRIQEDGWDWIGGKVCYKNLPIPSLLGDYQVQNAAMVIAGLSQFELPVSEKSIQQGLQTAYISGRLQTLQHSPEILLDVAHNPQSAQQLAKYLQKNKKKGKTRAIFSILSDKDVKAVVSEMASTIDEWHLIALDDPRAIPVNQLKSQLKQLGINIFSTYTNFKDVFNCVKSISAPNDRVVIFGSFLVVSGITSISSD